MMLTILLKKIKPWASFKRHLYSFGVLLMILNKANAQMQLELANGSYPSAPNGLTTASQTASLLQNTSGSSFVAFNPTITVTAFISNQQYNSISTSRISTAKAINFGGRVNSYGIAAKQMPVYNYLNAVDNPVNSQYTSNYNGPVSNGINVTDNYGFYFYNSVEGLYANAAATNGRYYFGDLTLTFSQPVSNPVLHIVGLGSNVLFGVSDKQGFTTELELQTSGATLSKLSGSTELNVTNNKILNSAVTPNFDCGNGAACGSVKVQGSNITSLTFKVYVRGDGNGSAWGHPAITAGDEFILSTSINTPVIISGNVFDDANGLTDNTVNGTGTNISNSLFINLVDNNNVVVASTAVANDGTYSFVNVGDGNYTIQVTTIQGTQGNAAPAIVLPASWINTGENLGSGNGNDGTPNGKLPITINGSNISNANFGLTLCSNAIATTITASGPTTACLGTGLTLTSTAAVSYQWYRDTTPVAGANSQTFIPTVSGTYSMHLITGGGACNISSNSISVTINYAATPSISPNGDTVVICPSNDKLCPAVWGYSNYQWYKDSVAIAAPAGTASCLTPTTNGYYSLAAQNGSGCWSLQSAKVYVVIDTVCSSIVSGGGGGGLETKPLGDVIAKRLYGDAVNSKSTVTDYNNTPAFVTSSGVIINGNGNLKLADFVPQTTANTNKANVSTPTDIISFTNAVDVLSVDYTNNNNCKAVVLGTQTIGEVYGHTKPICDRLKDAKLLEVKKVNISGIDMIASKLQQRDGLVEYCINFSVGLNKNDNKLRIQSNWLTDNYTQQDTMYNLQVWSVSYNMSKTLVEQMLSKLNTYKPVVAHNNNVIDMPTAYIQAVQRDKNMLSVTVYNPTNSLTGSFSIIEKANENSITVSKTIPFAINPNTTSTIKINVNDVYENNIYMHIDNNSDMVYMTDGGWSVDYDKTATTLNKFNVTNSVVTIKDNEYPLFRKVQIEASTKKYVTAYKLVKGGGIERDFSQYKAIKFNATSLAGSTVTVTLIKKGITDWNNQYTYSVQVNNTDQEYAIDLSKFVSKATTDKITANDITAVSFTWQNNKGVTANIGGALYNVRFTTTASANTTTDDAEIVVYPNPNNGKFKAVFNADAAKPVVIKLTDASTGRIIHTQFVNAVKGTNTIDINIKGFFTSEMYILSIEADDIKYNSKKVFIQNIK